MTGRLVHFELEAVDTEQAKEFFAALFGWTPQQFGDDGYFYVDGKPSGGLMVGRPGGGTVYFDVEDIESATARVRELGGDADEIQDLPGIGRSAHCRDEQGTGFGVFEWAHEAGSDG